MNNNFRMNGKGAVVPPSFFVLFFVFFVFFFPPLLLWRPKRKNFRALSFFAFGFRCRRRPRSRSLKDHPRVREDRGCRAYCSCFIVVHHDFIEVCSWFRLSITKIMGCLVLGSSPISSLHSPPHYASSSRPVVGQNLLVHCGAKMMEGPDDVGPGDESAHLRQMVGAEKFSPSSSL
jgi:hypothetical protein